MTDASDVLGMSDEDFLKNPPAAERNAPVEPVEKVIEPEVKVEKTVPAVKVVVEPEVKVEAETPVVEIPEVPTKKPKKSAKVIAEPETSLEEPKTEEDDEPEVKDTSGEADESADGATDYKAFYDQIMTPFKANGRTVELKTPQEAVQLMQMGANYTRKMQELAPQKKLLTMLQNNGLMDEGKLAYLIDLDKKNPEAIKKLIKEAGIDPQEIDTSIEPAYREGNHRVSDEDVAFQSVLDDMKSTPDRLKTISVINENWDQASKEAIWKTPGIMTTIHEQRENGVYDRVATEVNRQKTLGAIPANVPFLQAYKIVGDQMTQAKAFDDLNLSKTTPKSKATVVATRVEAPKPTLKNSAKAAAASSNRQTSVTPKKALGSVETLSMSDDAFLKQFAGRV
jgi:hypothetical protein